MCNISPLTSAISFFHPKKSYTQAASGISPSWEQEGAWGSGRGLSCSIIASLRVQSPPGPGVGYDLLKDHRIWLQDNPSSSVLNKASQEGVGATGAAVCSFWVLPAPLLACPHHIPSAPFTSPCYVTPGQEPASAEHQWFTPSSLGYTNPSFLPSSQQSFPLHSLVSFQRSSPSRGEWEMEGGQLQHRRGSLPCHQQFSWQLRSQP